MPRLFGLPSASDPRPAIAMTSAIVVLATILLAAGVVASPHSPTTIAARGSDHQATPETEGSPVPCGVAVTSWGAAIASDVRIQLVSLEIGAPGTATAAPPPTAVTDTLVQVEITNLGTAPVLIRPEDVTVLTCRGLELHPVEETDPDGLRLGTYAPGDAESGTLRFAVPPDDQARHLSIEIQEESRTGARIDCDLVVAYDNTSGSEISVGCSAQGGNALDGADATGTGATATPAR
jgi:hypothetical protein